VSCKDKDGHPHPMEKLGFDLDDGSSPADAKQTNPQVTYNLIYKYYFVIGLKDLRKYIIPLFFLWYRKLENYRYRDAYNPWYMLANVEMLTAVYQVVRR